MKPYNIPWRELKGKGQYLVYVQRDLIQALNDLDLYTGFKVVCHIIYDDDRGPTNYHYLGMAADLHIEGMHPLDQWMFVERLNLFTGIGVYGPDVWHNPGLHVDIRDVQVGARWAFRAEEQSGRIQVPLNRKYIKYLTGIMP